MAIRRGQTKAKLLLENFKIDQDKFRKDDYGILSLSKKLGDKIAGTLEMLQQIDKYYFEVSHEKAELADRVIDQLEILIDRVVKMGENDYKSQHDNVVNQFNNYYKELKDLIEPFQIEELKEKVKSLENDSKSIEKKRLVELNKELEETINEAKDNAEKAKSLFKTSSETIDQTSLKTAQDIFTSIQVSSTKKADLWLKRTLVSIVLLIITAIIFLSCNIFNDDNVGSQIQKGLLKIAILGGLIFIVNLCIRMFRAYIHIAKNNEHRAAISNAMTALIGSAASDPETKNEIVKTIVRSLSDFGSSGIISGKSTKGDGEINVGALFKLFDKAEG